MKAVLRNLVRASPAAYRMVNRLRGWRVQDPDAPLPTVTVGGDGGPHNYGSWDLPRDFQLTPASIVYSAGIGFDVSFDLEVIDRWGCTVHAWDPGDEVRDFLAAQALPPRFRFQQVALGTSDGSRAFIKSDGASYSVASADTPEASRLQTRTLASLMAERGHDRIDLLKMDIEGFEYEVLDQMLETDLRPHCILVEFHHMQQQRRAETLRSVQRLKEAGYRNFWMSDLGAEYGFIR
jgi:FkbM family methyltransferase